LQATGRDARGRKQYRYHPDWRTARDATKYDRLARFARALPRIRRRVARDLRKPGIGREKVLAAMVRLLETTLIRVGNEEYARTNHSYGLSTLRDRHVSVRRDTVHFHFTGKGGRMHELDLRDRRLARLMQRLQDLPGQELFQFVDRDGSPQKISSEDVNAYLRDAAGDEFSAKDFRTWAGTVTAALFLAECARLGKGRRPRKADQARAVDLAAKRLGNTATICRKCYIHPAVLDGFLQGKLVDVVGTEPVIAPAGSVKLTPGEEAVLNFIERARRQVRARLA
jgi:DNA topoisomerase I